MVYEFGQFERAANDARAVSRVAQALSMHFFESMDMHVARGWLARARSVLPAEPQGPEHGTLAALSARFAVGEGDLERAVDEAEKAIAIARALPDPDTELFAMSYLGIALVARGDVERGLAVHDEAAAILATGHLGCSRNDGRPGPPPAPSRINVMRQPSV